MARVKRSEIDFIFGAVGGQTSLILSLFGDGRFSTEAAIAGIVALVLYALAFIFWVRGE